jgi:hypothetical protein
MPRIKPCVACKLPCDRRLWYCGSCAQKSRAELQDRLCAWFETECEKEKVLTEAQSKRLAALLKEDADIEDKITQHIAASASVLGGEPVAAE